MPTISAQPETIEQVQSEIQKWLGGPSRDASRWCTFSRASSKTNLRVFLSHTAQDIKVEMKERCLVL